MRLKKEMVQYIAQVMAKKLTERGYVTYEGNLRNLEALFTNVIIDDLSVEDRLNEEVREILEQHQEKIDRGNIDYHKMFLMIKRKLAQERGLVL
ncbi:DUF507 family protein [Nitrospinae bacterium AH-259-F20]|nr:DUF507 family protein [Nitrospinae bacterium AH-259-F20]